MVKKTPTPHILRVIHAGWGIRLTEEQKHRRVKETFHTSRLLYLPRICGKSGKCNANTEWNGGIMRVICVPEDQYEYFVNGLCDCKDCLANPNPFSDTFWLRPPNAVLGPISNQRAWVEDECLKVLRKTHGIAMVSDSDLRTVSPCSVITGTTAATPMTSPKDFSSILGTIVSRFINHGLTFSGVATGITNPNANRGDGFQSPISHRKNGQIKHLTIFNEHIKGHYPKDQHYLEDIYRGYSERALGGKVATMGERFVYDESSRRVDYKGNPVYTACLAKLDQEFPGNKFGIRMRETNPGNRTARKVDAAFAPEDFVIHIKELSVKIITPHLVKPGIMGNG